MAKTVPSLAEEIDKALAEVSGEPSSAEEIEDDDAGADDSDAGGSGDADADDDAGESGDADGDEADDSDDGEEEGDTEGAEEEGAEGAETPEQKAAREKAAAAKEPDAVNDPIPKGLNEKTEKRMKTLIDTVKNLTGERDTAKRDNDFLVGAIRDTGSTPQQYGEALGFLKLLNSGDKEQQKTALGLAKQVVLNIAAIIGEPVGELDVLSGHQDLLQRVQAGKLTRADAEEVALSRNQGKLRTNAETAVRTESQQKQQRATDVATGQSALNDLEKELQASDPRYAEKRAKLLADAATMAEINKLPPSQWAGAFSRAYLKIKLAPKSAPTRVPTNQPMRARTRAGGSVPAAKSMLDAVNGALAEMGK